MEKKIEEVIAYLDELFMKHYGCTVYERFESLPEMIEFALANEDEDSTDG